MPSPRASQSTVIAARKRSVSQTWDAQPAAEAQLLSPIAPETVESLLQGFVARPRPARPNRQQSADQCADAWNSVLDQHGSFADSHATL